MINRQTMERIAVYLVMLFSSSATLALGQSPARISLQECQQKARSHYPLLKQLSLIEKTRDYSLENASKGLLPQISVNGQATYQSAVTQLPISVPGMNIPTISKDQYRLYSEVNQPLTDAVTINRQKELIRHNDIVEEQKIEVSLYQLRERVNMLFFGVLIIDAQLEQTGILRKDIEAGIDKARAAIANGVALKSSVNLLEAELLKVGQKTIELKSARKGYCDMLAMFINESINESTTLERPALTVAGKGINRPELKLFDAQLAYFDAQKKLVDTKNIPHLGVFLQGGYGRPALNMLSNEFDFFYVGGLRLNWNLTGFYTAGREKKLLDLHKNSMEVQKETFLLNTSLSLTQQDNELARYRQLIATDKEIIALRETIKNTSKNQLEYGTITINDYLLNVNAEDQAKQSMLLHDLQLLMASYNYQTTSGN